MISSSNFKVMNANSSLTIANWLTAATASLKQAGISSASLDALLLLESTIRKDRAHILAHPEIILTPKMISQLDDLLSRRRHREPIPYLTGSVEFYGRNFKVTPDVLIPRPESEALIEELLKLPLAARASIVDIGTGSGILGITTALELPSATITLTDISDTALVVARSNAASLGVDPTLTRSDLLTVFQAQKFDIIIANLPYVDHSWERSPETTYEPALALFAPDNGLSLIKRLIVQSSTILSEGGYLVLEADPRQFSNIVDYASGHGFTEYTRNGYCLILTR